MISNSTEQAMTKVRQIAPFKARAKKVGIPVIYVNDNYGRYQSGFHQVVRHCMQEDTLGRKMSELLEPDEDDYFVIKPKH